MSVDASFGSAWTLDSLPVGVWVGAVPGGEVVYTNAAFRSIVGMEAVSTSRINDVPTTYHVRDRQGEQYPVERLPFARVVSELRPVIVDDMVLHRSDGVSVYLRAFGLPKRDHAGKLVEVVVAFVDITREVTVEAERDLMNARLDLVVNHTPIIIWAADMEGNVTLSEGAGLQRLGVVSGQLVGQNIFALYGDHPTIPGFIRRGLAGESLFYTSEVGPPTFLTTFDTWITPLRDATGAMSGVAAVSHDVSETRQLQTRAIQHDHQIALGLLAASVAHEINNPITYVLGSSSTLDRELARLDTLLAAANPEVRTTLARIRAELGPIKEGATRIATITRDLRSFSRADDERHSISIDDVLRSALQLVGKELETRARLTVRLAAGEHAVQANHARLLQVFLNLLTNAMQALPATGEHAIEVRSYVDGAKVIVDVSDSGPGVPVELRERIFDPFMTTKRVGEGTGLGLFVSRNIVGSLGGTIEVDDAPRGGALFRVALPIESPSAAASPASTPARGARPATRILVIDDDPLVLRALVAHLSSNPSYQVTGLGDSQRALAVLESERFDLVYCDLMMAGMTGMALDRALRERSCPNAARMVFMTGGAFTPDGQAFVRENADRVVDKPFDILGETAHRLANA